MSRSRTGRITRVRSVSRGRRAAVLQGDLRDPGVGPRLVKDAEQALGPVDILIANAGLGVQKPWEEVDEELWDATLTINLKAPFFMAKAVLPGMIERRFG